MSRQCPACCAGDVVISFAFVAKPVGDFSLAGAQVKVSGRYAAIAECMSCTWSVYGRLVDPVTSEDGRNFVGGHFEVDPSLAPKVHSDE